MSTLEEYFRAYIKDNGISNFRKPIYMSTSTIAEMIEDIDKLRAENAELKEALGTTRDDKEPKGKTLMEVYRSIDDDGRT